MSFWERFKRQSTWVKVGSLGSIASIVGIPLAFYLSSAPPQTQQHAGNNSTQVGTVQGDVTIYNQPQESGNAGAPRNEPKTEGPPADLLEKIASPGRGLRYAEQYLGTPIEETQTHRVYEKYGYRFTLLGISQDKSYEAVEIGPAGNMQTIPPLNLSGPWGKIHGHFGSITIGSLDKALTCTRISDWNYGAHSPCMNVFEVECGGSQSQSSLYVRAGILDYCHYSGTGTAELTPERVHKFFVQAYGTAVGKTTPSPDQLFNDPPSTLLELSLIAEARVNFLTISPKSRAEPRGGSGE